MFDALDTGASGLLVQRTRLDVIAANLANVSTTHDAQGRPNPYRRRFAVVASGSAYDPSKPGAHVAQIKQDMSPFIPKWDEGSRQWIMHPNVDPTVEFVNAIEASRAYEANVTMMDVTKQMINASLRILA